MVAVGPDDGTVEGRAQSCAEDDRDPLHAGRQGRQGIILDELCRTTGWNRDHARKGTTYGVDPSRRHSTRTSARKIRTEGHCGAGILLGMPAGKRLAPTLPELVPLLRRFSELAIDDDTVTLGRLSDSGFTSRGGAGEVPATARATLGRRHGWPVHESYRKGLTQSPRPMSSRRLGRES